MALRPITLSLGFADIGVVDPFAPEPCVDVFVQFGVDPRVALDVAVFFAGGFKMGATFGSWTMRPALSPDSIWTSNSDNTPARCHGSGWWWRQFIVTLGNLFKKGKFYWMGGGDLVATIH